MISLCSRLNYLLWQCKDMNTVLRSRLVKTKALCNTSAVAKYHISLEDELTERHRIDYNVFIHEANKMAFCGTAKVGML